MKRLISMILCFAVCLSLLSGLSVSAEGEMKGTGTPEDPYQIETAEHLIQFRDKVNKGGETSAWAVLVNDIVFNQGITFGYKGLADLTNSDVVEGNPMDHVVVLINGQPLTEQNMPKEKWVPISVPVITQQDYLDIMDNKDVELVNGWYNGVFDGQGHTISGLFCDYQQEVAFSSMSAAGLFTSLGENGVVRNVGVVNSFFRGDAAAAVVVGNQGMVHGCYSDAIVVGYPKPASEGEEENTSTRAYAGGICTVTIKENAAIERCYFTGKVEGIVEYDDAGRPEDFQSHFGGILASVGLFGKMTGATEFTNNYYIDAMGSAQPKGCYSRNEKEFKSGKVAYLLNESKAVDENSLMFRQNLDQGSRESYPSYSQSSGEIFQVKGCKNTYIYSNANADKNYHEYDSNGVCMNGCEKQAAAVVTADGATTYVETLDEAFTVSGAKDVSIKVLATCGLEYTVLKESCYYTLDLNGQTVYAQESINVNGSGSVLVIRDSVGGGLLHSDYSSPAVYVSGGELYVESGVISFSEGTDPAIRMSEGYVEISGGEFVCDEGSVSVELTESAILTGGKFQGMRCEVPISQILGTDQEYWAVTEDGEVLDTDENILEQTFEILPAGTYPTEPSEPTPEDPTKPTETEPTVPEPTPGNPDVVWPDEPEVEVDKTPVVGEPAFDGIPGECVADIYLVLDADPLLGITREELFDGISVQGYEGYEKVCQIEGYSEELGKVRTSDRLKISYKDGNKVVQSKTFVIVILGDTNCDGMAMANDAALMVKLVSNPGNESPEVLQAADVNRDGHVKANDAQRLIYRYFNYGLDYETPMN